MLTPYNMTDREQSGSASNGNNSRPPPKLIPRPEQLQVDTAPVDQLLSAGGYPDPATPPVSALEAELSLHPSLRSPDYIPTANMMSSGVPGDHSGGPPDHGLSPPGMDGEGRKAKRELSNSKRAAQNRAAQVRFPGSALDLRT